MRVLDTRMCNNSRFWNGEITRYMLCLEAESRKQAPCKVRERGQSEARGNSTPLPPLTPFSEVSASISPFLRYETEAQRG